MDKASGITVSHPPGHQLTGDLAALVREVLLPAVVSFCLGTGGEREWSEDAVEVCVCVCVCVRALLYVCFVNSVCWCVLYSTQWVLQQRSRGAHFGKDLADLGRGLGWFRSSWRPANMNRRNS